MDSEVVMVLYSYVGIAAGHIIDEYIKSRT